MIYTDLTKKAIARIKKYQEAISLLEGRWHCESNENI